MVPDGIIKLPPQAAERIKQINLNIEKLLGQAQLYLQAQLDAQGIETPLDQFDYDLKQGALVPKKNGLAREPDIPDQT